MENKNQPNGKQLQIDVSPEIAKGLYSNFAIISHSTTEFVADFASLLPGAPKAQVVSRIVIAPAHAKRLLLALQENLMRYEQENGTIELAEAQGRTIAPFGTPKGEA